jgi:hypothetical protein
VCLFLLVLWRVGREEKEKRALSPRAVCTTKRKEKNEPFREQGAKETRASFSATLLCSLRVGVRKWPGSEREGKKTKTREGPKRTFFFSSFFPLFFVPLFFSLFFFPLFLLSPHFGRERTTQIFLGFRVVPRASTSSMAWLLGGSSPGLSAEPEEAPFLANNDEDAMRALGRGILADVVRLCGLGGAASDRPTEAEGTSARLRAPLPGWTRFSESDDGSAVMDERFDWFPEGSSFPTICVTGVATLPPDAGDLDSAVRDVFSRLCSDELAVRQEWDRDMISMKLVKKGAFREGAGDGALSVQYRKCAVAASFFVCRTPPR